MMLVLKLYKIVSSSTRPAYHHGPKIGPKWVWFPLDPLNLSIQVRFWDDLLDVSDDITSINIQF